MTSGRRAGSTPSGMTSHLSRHDRNGALAARYSRDETITRSAFSRTARSNMW
jgi:hypothetical protein